MTKQTHVPRRPQFVKTKTNTSAKLYKTGLQIRVCWKLSHLTAINACNSESIYSYKHFQVNRLLIKYQTEEQIQIFTLYT